METVGMTASTETSRQPIPTRDAFVHFHTVPSRWADNDVYGHVNNAVYYFYFDTAVNRYLIDHGGLVIAESKTVGIVIETGCRYHRSFTYPEDIEAGIRVAHLGNSSVRYEVGLFAPGESSARADGHFVHVYVDRATMRPVPLPPQTRAALERLRVG
jgi:acyl-CoA thioester hydrolase